jgi:hypothetical protein
VIDPRTRALLHEAVRRASLSLLNYVGDAFPWTTAEGDAALAKLRQIVAEDREATGALGRFLAKKRMPPPFIGSYPGGFTTMNFVGLDYLLPRLVAAQRQEVAALERDRGAVTDAEARAEWDKVLAVKRRHLTALERLTSPGPAPTPTAPAPHPEPAAH